MLFLQILAAVLVALLLAVFVAWWAFKRWLRGKVAQYGSSAALIGDRYSMPARIHLQATHDPLDEDGQPLWSRLHALGFRPLGDYESRQGNPAWLRAAWHAEASIAAALANHGGQWHFAMFTVGGAPRVHGLSDGPGESLRTGVLHWDVEPTLAPEEAFARLQAATADRECRVLDAAAFRDICEIVHAQRMDALLARPPRHDWLEAVGARQSPPASPAQIDHALDYARSQWQSLLGDAVLDRFRRHSRIDAVQWERIEGDLHVVHGHLPADEIRDLLADSESDRLLWQQLVAQGLDGIALYESLAARLPAARQRQKLAEFRTPLLTRVYGRLEDASAAQPARTHHYEAVDADGRAVAGAVIARDSGEAKRQLQSMGLAEAKVMNESIPLGETPNFMLDPEIAAMAARSAREGLGMALLRAARGNLWLWFPPALLLTWSLAEGAPYGWGDYLVFGYSVLAALVLLLFTAPMVLYNQLLQSRTHARWRTARLCLALLSRLNLFGAMRPEQLLIERCKIMAGEGQVEAALSLWDTQQSKLTNEQFLSGLVQLHDALGNTGETIAAQRALLAAQPQDMTRIDLAMSLSRHGHDVDEAEDLLAGIDPNGLSELARSGFQFARGLVAAQRGQAAVALRHYAQAIETASQYRSNPLIQCVIAEINGHSAIALKASGDTARAETLWRQVRPLLARHPSCREVIARYEA